MSEQPEKLVDEYERLIEEMSASDGIIIQLKQRIKKRKDRLDVERQKAHDDVSELERAIRARVVIIKSRAAERIKRKLLRPKMYGNKTNPGSVLRSPADGERTQS